MLDKFSDIEEKFEDLERKISDPEVIGDQKVYQELILKHAELKGVVSVYRDLKRVKDEMVQAEELLADEEMKEMAEAEIRELKEKEAHFENQLRVSLLPSDPNDKKNVIIEIRQGTGGDEAALFAGNLFRMYKRYADSKKWTVEIISESLTGLGGVKEVVFSISGTAVFGRLKFESGTHRVQRVPHTEASGRLHTSAATVAIMPEAEDVDLEIDPKDLRIDVYRASGSGGQHVNKTSSAVRITHVPTGAVAACQDERSQFQNKEKAMRVLRTRMYEKQVEEKRKKNADLRKGQVGTGDRSEKIRTYNFPQNRVTDHRINFSSHSMTNFLDGDMEELLDALVSADQLAQMQAA
ncbi:MAG: peptide chain release factor 1 [Candidatus Marinamargulisbacteria bacterium]|jgi:peptide chain release factor 1